LKRGDLYWVRRPGGGDPRRSRVFVVVSRELLIQSGFSTVIGKRPFHWVERLAQRAQGQIRDPPDDHHRRRCDGAFEAPFGFLFVFDVLKSLLSLAGMPPDRGAQPERPTAAKARGRRCRSRRKEPQRAWRAGLETEMPGARPS
jgi:mRNA interferase MazF